MTGDSVKANASIMQDTFENENQTKVQEQPSPSTPPPVEQTEPANNKPPDTTTDAHAASPGHPGHWSRWWGHPKRQYTKENTSTTSTDSDSPGIEFDPKNEASKGNREECRRRRWERFGPSFRKPTDDNRLDGTQGSPADDISSRPPPCFSRRFQHGREHDDDARYVRGDGLRRRHFERCGVYGEQWRLNRHQERVRLAFSDWD